MIIICCICFKMHKLLVFMFSDCHSYFSIGTEYVTLIWEKMPLIIEIWLALEGDSGGDSVNKSHKFIQ